MRVSVDPERCELHGLCEGLAPAVFDTDQDEDVVTVTRERPGPDQEAGVWAAVGACPRQAISVTAD